MLNLRQFGSSQQTMDNSEDLRFSQLFTLNFRVPSSFLGNIGEPLDHSQATRYIYGEGDNSEETTPCTVLHPRLITQIIDESATTAASRLDTSSLEDEALVNKCWYSHSTQHHITSVVNMSLSLMINILLRYPTQLIFNYLHCLTETLVQIRSSLPCACQTPFFRSFTSILECIPISLVPIIILLWRVTF